MLTNTSSATTYQIGSGTVTNTQKPLYSCYTYNYSQQIYTVAELNTAGASGSQVISQIRFFYSTAALTPANYNNWTVYVGNTAQASFASTTNWVAVGSMTQVFSGTVTFPAVGNWMTINLSTPFTWNGTSNLVVAVDENSAGYSCTAAFRSYTSTTNRSIGYYSDPTNPSPSAPPTANLAPSTIMPQIQFEMTSANNCTVSTPGSITGPTTVCGGSTINLSISGQAAGSGVAYQWQSSPAGTNTWTNLGSTVASYSGVVSVATDFRCSVTCSYGGGTQYTPIYSVSINSFTNCYCSSNATSTADEEILGVSLGGMVNNSTCGQLGGTGSIAYEYSNYKAVSPGTITKGNTETISLTLGYCNGTAYTSSAAVFIDYNHDGVFNATTERVYNSPYQAYDVGGSVVNGTFTVPTTTLLGNTGMRVVYVESNSAPSPCGTYSWGETEDYIVNIQAPAPMTLNNIIVTQQTGTIGAGATGTILSINVKTNGLIGALTVSGFNLSTTGTTNDGEIVSAKIYSTGSSNVYTTTNTFGTYNAPTGVYNINGLITLGSGNNYFWLAYEAAPWITNCSDAFDATCDYVTVAGNLTAVSNGNPTGTTPVVPAIVATNLLPANGYTASCRNVLLSWTAITPYTAYDVYVDGSLFAVNVTTGSKNVALAGTHTWDVVPAGSSPSGCFTHSFTAASVLCYCIPSVSYGCGDNDIIARVTVNTLDNNSGTSCPSDPVPGNQGSGVNGNGYSDYTSNTSLTTTLMQGYTYPVTVYVGQWSESFAIWVDGNDDGEFSSAERVGYTTTNPVGSGVAGVLGGSATFPIVLDCNSPIGTHRMRVRCVWGTSGSAITPCASASYGETEDYNITYILGPVTQPVAAIVTGPTEAVCNTNLTYIASTYVGALQWQYSVDFTNWIDIAGATNATQGILPNGPAFFALRVRSRGIGCTADVFSEMTFLNVVSPTVSITQSVTTICRGTSATLTASSDYPNAVYTWSNGQTGASITVNPLVETTYSVSVGAALCSATASVTVSVVGPTATISNTPSTTNCPGTQHTLTGNLITGMPVSGGYTVSNVLYSTVSGSGTAVTLADDQLSGAISLPFSFIFYGNTYNSIYISSNGFITFDAAAGSGCCSGQVLPSTTTPNNLIALDWEDLNPSVGGTIQYYTNGSSFVVDFTNIQHYSYATATITGQIVLNSDGTIQINNTSVNSDNDGTGDTQGIENSGGTMATPTMGRNGVDFSSINQSYLFTPPSSATFIFDGPVTYTWSSSETTSNISVSPNVTTTYSLTVADNSCSSTSTVTVGVYTPPVVTASNNGPICNGATTNLTTNLPSGSTIYTFHLTDSYGDGWNGALMEVRQGSTVVTTLGSSFTTGTSQDVPVTLNTNVPYSLVYTTTGSWPSEVGIQVIDNLGVTVSTTSAGTGVIGSLYNWTPIPAITYSWSGGNAITSGNNTANPSGNTTYSVTVTDNHGCTASASTDVTVVYPSIICPGDITVGSDFGMCGALVDIGTAIAGSQPCTSTVTNNHPSMEYPVGTTTVIWTVIDAYGNTSTCNQNVVVTDVENPIITCPTNVIVCSDPGACTATVNLGTPISSDNCGVLNVVNNHPSNQYPFGDTEVVWTVTDVNGNSSTCTQMVTVNDCENPSLVVPSDITSCSDISNCGANVNIGQATATDNCGVLNITNDHQSSEYLVGTTTVTWTTTDIHGNTSSMAQTVVINDCENPVITCPSNVLSGTDPGMCGVNINIGTPITTDNCGIDVTTNNHQDSYYPVGTTTVTWSVTDIHGNISTCDQQIVVNDSEAPVINGVHPSSIVECPATPIFSNPSVTDNCSATMSYNDVTTQNCGNTYTTTRTWTATDSTGNITTTSETITVRDITPPSITCNPAVYLCYEESNPVLPTPVTSDVCNIVTVTNSGNGIYPVGTTSVIWTATDACGNTSSCNQNVVRNSQINASFTVQALPGYCQGNVIITIINASGGSGSLSYLWSNGATTASVSVPNNATYTCTVTDQFSSVGSTYNCSRTFTVVANLNTTSTLSSYTIIGTNDVHIHGYQTILNGGVGATSITPTGSGCTGGRIKLHQHSVANSSTTFLKAKCIEVDATSTVNNQFSGSSANPPMPIFDAGVVVPTSAANVTVAANTVVTLSGTVYGNIIVKTGGKLTFLHATIDCKKLQLMDGATIRGDKACTRIRMEGNLMVMKNVIVNPSVDNHDFAIYVDNTNTSGSGGGVGSGGSGSDANASVVIQQSAQVKAFIYAPNGVLEVHGPGGNGNTSSGSGSGIHSVSPATSMTGLFIAHDVNSHGRTTWNWNTTCMTCNYTLRDGETTDNASETLKKEDLKAGKIVENFPDPFTGKTNIRFVMDKNTHTEVTVYDLTGKLIKTVYNGEVKANQEYRFEFDGSDLPNGLYLYKVMTPESEHVGKLLLIKE